MNPLADVAQIMQLKQAQALLPLRIQEAQTQQQESALRLQQLTQAENDRKAQDAAWKGALTVDDSGKPTIDRGKLTQLLPGHLVPLANETLDKLDKSREDLTKLKQENQKMIDAHGAGVGKFLADSEYAPGAYRAILPIEVANGVTTPQVAQQLLQQLDAADQQDPTGAAAKAIVKAHADKLLSQAPADYITAQARATTAQTGQARETREAAIAPLQQKKLEQETTGTVPITPYQQAQLDAKNDPLERNPTEASLAMTVAKGKRPGATPEEVQASRDAELALKRLDQSKREARPVTNVTLATPAEQQSAAQMLTEGKIDPATARSMIRRQPALLAQARAIDPNFDEVDIDNRYNTAKEFSSSSNTKAGGQVIALNTLIHHADLYLQAADALKNGNFRPGNAAYNAVSNLLGSPAPQNAALVARFLAGETAKVATGGVPAEGQINETLKALGTDAGPEQMRQAGQKLLEIGSGRMIPLKEKRDQAHLEKQFPIVGQDAAAILQKRGFDPNTLKPAAETGKAEGQGGYIVGHKYGGLTYQGGDPNKRESWK